MSGPVKLYIATTEGPSQVQRVTPEDPEVNSVICINGTTQALTGVEYDPFVRSPTGVIHRDFGHPVYRVDVSHPFTSGSSWQLGLYLAHSLFAAGRLAIRDHPSSLAVWTTGEVDRDLNVRAISHLEEKLRRSRVLFQQLAAAGSRLLVICPASNQLDNPVWSELGITPEQLLPIARVDEALNRLGLPLPAVVAPARRRVAVLPPMVERRVGFYPATGPRWRLAIPIALALLVGMGWMAVAGDGHLLEWQALRAAGNLPALDARLREAREDESCRQCRLLADGYSAYLRLSAPRLLPAAIALTEERTPGGTGCKATQRVTTTAAPDHTARFPPSKLGGLCKLAYRVHSSGDHAALLAWSGTTPAKGQRLAVVGAGELELIATPLLKGNPAQVTLLALSAYHPLPTTLDGLSKLVPEQEWTSNLATRLGQLGVGVAIAHHPLIPPNAAKTAPAKVEVRSAVPASPPPAVKPAEPVTTNATGSQTANGSASANNSGANSSGANNASGTDGSARVTAPVVSQPSRSAASPVVPEEVAPEPLPPPSTPHTPQPETPPALSAAERERIEQARRQWREIQESVD